MGILFDFLEHAGDISAESKAALADRGTLDPDQVLVRFRTQEDDRVRPTHEALDGTVWEPGDPDAPVPPLDYGCRCYVEYLAKPGTLAAKFLPVTDLKATRVAAAYAKYLDKNIGEWRKFLADLDGQHLAKIDRMGECVLFVEDKKPSLSTADVREYARMIIQAGKNG